MKTAATHSSEHLRVQAEDRAADRAMLRHIMIVGIVFFALILSGIVQAAQICTATTRGATCTQVPDCAAGTVYNPLVGLCLPSACPAGTVGTPKLGGGLDCLPDASGSRSCLPGYVWRPDLGRCDYPAVDPVACSMTVEWVGLDPQNVQVVAITPAQQCHDGADLATARVQVQLLGGK